MLSADKREDTIAPAAAPAAPTVSEGSVHKRARVERHHPSLSPDRSCVHADPPPASVQHDAPPNTPPPVHAPPAARGPDHAVGPYFDLQQAVHNALEGKTATLTTSDKVALALEVLRARQLELDLAQARNNIEALVTKASTTPRTLRAVIPASTVKGLPVGFPIDISNGKFLLSPTTNDPQALFLTLELQSFGPQKGVPNHPAQPPNVSGSGERVASTTETRPQQATERENNEIVDAPPPPKDAEKDRREEPKPL